jgi:hypothetical protein
MTEDEILARARDIGNARHKARQRELEHQRHVNRVQNEQKLKQALEAVILAGSGEISDDQLQLCITAFEEYNYATEWLYQP